MIEFDRVARHRYDPAPERTAVAEFDRIRHLLASVPLVNDLAPAEMTRFARGAREHRAAMHRLARVESPAEHLTE
ncbi:hypothetical protein [Aromatoleum petrolei]|uniref:Uncharacterized protein n=1 Tax=Aromatoleum petrolei TaxID=76116 RepID=A0ABX1MPP4_9RHOO|nr:hypothetical protein [Aromatoleum petrolei]NMF88618.1 hypothetical protein [Aromatoleum petrolei]QTQ34674.1 Uncharacterized protein ToN1_05010 [Aromatoleum petrolei]